MFLLTLINCSSEMNQNGSKWNVLNLGISHISKLVVCSCFLVFFPVDQIGMKILPPRQTVERLGIVFFISLTSTFGLHYVELDGLQSGLICSVMLNWFWWNTPLWYQQLSCVYYKLCYLSSSQCRPWKCCNGLKMTQVTESGAAIAARLPCAAPAIS